MKSPSRCFYELFILFIGITLLPFIGIPLLSESLLLASSYFPTSYWHPPIGIRLLALLTFCFLFRLQCAHVPTLCPNGPVTFSFDLPFIIHSIILLLSIYLSIFSSAFSWRVSPALCLPASLEEIHFQRFSSHFRNQFPSSSRGPLPFTHRWGIRFFSYSLVVSSTHLLLSSESEIMFKILFRLHWISVKLFHWSHYIEVTEAISLKSEFT